MDQDQQNALQIVYDGECPFCACYVTFMRLRKSAGPVVLINARDDHPTVKDLLKRGYDLDKGMAVIDQNRIYHGADAVTYLSALSSGSTIFNRLIKTLFRHKIVADMAYPLLRFARNAALFFKGRKQLREHYKHRRPAGPA